RSCSGNQRDRARATVGHAPASPAPNRALSASSDGKFHATPVSPVKADHHTTIRVRTRRLPIRSAHQPVGISNSAYAAVNALKTNPIWIVDRRRSRIIAGAVTEMHT